MKEPDSVSRCAAVGSGFISRSDDVPDPVCAALSAAAWWPWVGSGPRHDIAVAESFSGGGWQLRVAGGRLGALKGKPETGKLPADMIHSR